MSVCCLSLLQAAQLASGLTASINQSRGPPARRTYECRTNLKMTSSTAESQAEALPSENTLLQIFIGPRAQSYIDALYSEKAGFSFAGFLFGAYWLLYRKMYAHFFLLLALLFFGAVLGAIIGLSAEAFFAFSILPNIIYGLIWFFFFASFAQQKVRAYMHQPKYSPKFFAEAGGTALSQPIVWLFAQAVVLFILYTPFLQY